MAPPHPARSLLSLPPAPALRLSPPPPPPSRPAVPRPPHLLSCTRPPPLTPTPIITISLALLPAAAMPLWASWAAMLVPAPITVLVPVPVIVRAAPWARRRGRFTLCLPRPPRPSARHPRSLPPRPAAARARAAAARATAPAATAPGALSAPSGEVVRGEQCPPLLPCVRACSGLGGRAWRRWGAIP